MTTEKLIETSENLRNTKVTLKETKITLRDTEQDRNEQRFLVDEHVKTETDLFSQATEVGLEMCPLLLIAKKFTKVI